MISAKIVADSLNESGDRLTTFIVTFPRIILSEFNTHRMFSRNSASSRAIPFKKMLEMVKEDPFIPIAWQKDHKGMQGTEYIIDRTSVMDLEAQWREASYLAVKQARKLNELGLTKQLCNRLLEPFMWHTVIITATEWENFFALRCPQYTTPVMGEGFYARSWKDLIKNHSDPDNIAKMENMGIIEKLQHNKGQAEIHMMALAEAMWDAMNESTPEVLEPNQWHIPFKNKINLTDLFINPPEKPCNVSYTTLDGNIPTPVKISVAMAARTSYTLVGEEGKEPNYENDIKLHDILATSGHWSPFEHCARVMNRDEASSRIYMTHGEHRWCRNFRGFIQYRSLID